MNRRQELENIIIGTLLESNEERNYFDDCRMLTADLFQDETNRRLFSVISDMNKNGQYCTDPCTIFQERFEDVKDIYIQMVGLCTDYSFIHKKMQFNERQFLLGCVDGQEHKKTDIQFEDYVDQFLKTVYYEERKTS